MTEYAAGTVAVATVRGVPNVRVFRYLGVDGIARWDASEPVEDRIPHADAHVTDVRPLVVLDLSDDPPLAVAEVLRSANYDWLASEIERQTKPPRIPEPGLWGVVEASVASCSRGRLRWVRTDGGWYSPRYGLPRWDDLIDPVLVRPGIEDES